MLDRAEQTRIMDAPPQVVDAWRALQAAAKTFKEVSENAQLWCQHKQAVQWNANYNPYKKPECQSHPFRVCTCCGLTEKAEFPLDPDSFSELGALNGAEIVAEYDIGADANFYRLPAMPRDTRLDAIIDT